MVQYYNGILFKYNEDEILLFVVKWIEVEDILLGEIVRYKLISIIFIFYVEVVEVILKQGVLLLGIKSVVGRERWGQKY